VFGIDRTGANIVHLTRLRHTRNYGLNACSLNIEKFDELHAATGINHVSLVCVTETWGSLNLTVKLTGFSCERKDRVDKGGGGIVSYVRNDVLYDRLDYLENDSFEVVWINIHPKRLPRRFSCVVVACLCHVPDADNTSMILVSYKLYG
jgi:hypothetical protein